MADETETEHDVAADQGPDFDEVRGFEEPFINTVPVSIDEPVHVRQLPAVDTQIVGRTVTATTAMKLIQPNEFRGRATLLADAAIYLGRTKSEADAALGKIPADTPIQLRAPVEFWAKSVTGTAMVTLILEQWVR